MGLVSVVRGAVIDRPVPSHWSLRATGLTGSINLATNLLAAASEPYLVERPLRRFTTVSNRHPERPVNGNEFVT
jgi:hypothetical protein